MSYKNLVELFAINEGKGAVGAFNIGTLEMLPYIILAAEECNAPVIVQATPKNVIDMGGYEVLGSVVKTLANSSSVSVCLHLDHSKKVEFIKMAIAAGFNSVMYDGSELSLKDNIENTKIVMKWCSEEGISVEAEVGKIGQSVSGIAVKNNDDELTNVEDARRFVESTDVNALAVSIGTTHWQYKSAAIINYDLLDELTSVLSTNLVLHGGTGVSNEDLKKCSFHGIKKINIGTVLFRNYIKSIQSATVNVDYGSSLRTVFDQANQCIEKITIEKINAMMLRKSC
jgi:fructose-bisphosphate aldolase class II